MVKPGPKPKTEHFAVTADTTGQLFVYCDRPSCPWIRKVPPHTRLGLIERVVARHTHPAV